MRTPSTLAPKRRIFGVLVGALLGIVTIAAPVSAGATTATSPTQPTVQTMVVKTTPACTASVKKKAPSTASASDVAKLVSDMCNYTITTHHAVPTKAPTSAAGKVSPNNVPGCTFHDASFASGSIQIRGATWGITMNYGWYYDYYQYAWHELYGCNGSYISNNRYGYGYDVTVDAQHWTGWNPADINRGEYTSADVDFTVSTGVGKVSMSCNGHLYANLDAKGVDHSNYYGAC